MFRSEWTLDRARTAELLGKANWKKHPAAMLKARAISECARDACEESLMGMHYTPEELGAEVDAEGEPIQATAEQLRPADPDWASKPATAHERATGQPERQPAPWADEEWQTEITACAATSDVVGLQNLWRRAKAERPGDIELREHITQVADEVKARQIHPAAEPAEQAPGGDEPIDAEIVEPTAEPPAEQKQHRAMHALLRKADVVDRDERLAVTSRIVGRHLDTSKDLTYAEADAVIQRLRAFDATGATALKEPWTGGSANTTPAAPTSPPTTPRSSREHRPDHRHHHTRC